MCFNKEMTLGFSLFAFAVGIWILFGFSVWKGVPKWRLQRLSACFFFFSFMEFIQFVQYLVLGDCKNQVNVFFTVLGWLHICFQPLFSNYAMSAMDIRNLNKERDQIWKFIHRLCMAVGSMMGLRMIIPAITRYNGDCHL